MDLRANPGLPEQLAAAFAWWRDAGVDCDFHDEPANWIAPAEPVLPAGQAAGAAEESAARFAPASASASAPTPAIDRSAWPQDLAAFASWWLAEPSLDSGRAGGRVPPRGAANADVMVLVPQPEKEDSDSLLSGPQGRLLDAMLAAMGIAPGESYVASVLPRYTPHADWAGIGAQGMGDVLAHHIHLAAPRRLIVLGGNILPLLGNDLPNSSETLRAFNYKGAKVPVLADRDLGAFLERPRWKSGLWQRWLDWAGQE